MSDTDFSIEWQGDIAVFTLRSPRRLNALTQSMSYGLSECLDEMPKKGARALVITGEGKAFCAGTDLKEASQMAPEDANAKADFLRELFFRMQQMPLTSIAAINGLALGGGLELALACTLRIATPSAGLGLPEVKLAVIPSYGGTQMLPALIGKSHATDIMLTGRTVPAEEALRIGLLNRLANEESPVLEQALAYAREITVNSQVAINNIRTCIDQSSAEVSRKGLDCEAQITRAQAGSHDVEEGIKAFLEKRPPRYLHR